MIIGIDIRVLGSRAKSGIEEYTESLLEHMLPLDSSIKFKLFFSSRGSDLHDYEWLRLKNVELHKFSISNKFLFASSNFLKKPLIDKMIGGADIFFSPHFLLTALSPHCKRVTTFHDLSYMHFSEFFSWRRSLWHRVEMKPWWQSKFSDKIIAVSDSTKKDLVQIYDIDPGKIEVIYSGISPTLKRPSDEDLALFRSSNSIPSEFILSLGKLEPRKNIISIVKAFNLIKTQKKFSNLHLVIAGSRGWLDDDIFKEANNSPHKGQIIFKGQVSGEDRKFYYGLASVFVYPSFFEGFGFPPLEAMQCGTPVIASNNTSLPEVVGRGGIISDPHNLGDLVYSITSVLTDQELRKRLISEGMARTSSFSWQNTAEKTLECILE